MIDGAQAKNAGAWALLGLWAVLFYPSFIAAATTAAGRGGSVLLLIAIALFSLLSWVSRRFQALLERPPAALFVGAVALISAGISGWFAVVMLGNKVLALDCSVYLLQARALAHGQFGVPLEVPGQYQSLRFLFEGPDGQLYGVFPPGYPLFLAPFERIGLPMLSGPVTAALLVVAQYALARAVGEEEWVARASLLLPLPSYARAIETADLLSHAFAALLATAALAAALRCVERPSPRLGAAVGALAGWLICARLLDGLVLALVLAVIAGVRAARGNARALARPAAVALLAALPFGGLLLAQQKAATGRWLQPTQSEFFMRADHPPTCHRLGFGPDVGCRVEHPPERASFGPDGYSLDDALRVGRERAVVLGNDLLGYSPLLIVGLLSLAIAPTGASLSLGLWWVGLGFSYLLFYYGNAPVYGARHLFPVAPAAYILVARLLPRLPRRSAGFFDRSHVMGAGLLCLLTVASVAQIERWRRAKWQVKAHQAGRAPIHKQAGEVQQAIVLTNDHFGTIAAIDPWRDRGVRMMGADDHSGSIELRRTHPDWPVFFATPTGLVKAESLPPLTPGLLVELELSWPSRLWTDGLAFKRVDTMNALKIAASGNEALGAFIAAEGGSAEVAFDVVDPGSMHVWVEGIKGPMMGRYELALDDHPLPPWEGYAPALVAARSPVSEPIELARGPHRLKMRCAGKAPESSSRLAVLDSLRGSKEPPAARAPAPPPSPTAPSASPPSQPADPSASPPQQPQP